MASIGAAKLLVSAITIGEIQAGIERTRARDKVKAREIEIWAEEIISVFNVLVIDTAIIRLWAKFMHRRSNEAYEDALLAATAKVHGLVLVTRNVKHFQEYEVEVLNPFEFEASRHS